MSPGGPNSICERFLGTLRRECLDHILIIGEGHLRRVLGEYCCYFNEARPHQSLSQRSPSKVRLGSTTLADLDDVEVGRGSGEIESIPVLEELHHEYRWAA